MTLPKPIPMLLSLLGVVVIASAAAGLFMALTQRPPAYFFLGFELVIVLAAVFVVLLGMGKIKDGPAITLLCAAGAIGVGALLGWQATGKQINGQSVTWLVTLRGLIAAALVLAAAADVALRVPSKTLPRIGWGLACMAPLLAGLVLVKMGTLGTLVTRLSGGSQPIAFGIWMVLGIFGGALLSAGGHLLITGFQIGVQAADQTGGMGTTGTGTQPAKPGAASQAARAATPPAPSSTPTGTTG